MLQKMIKAINKSAISKWGRNIFSFGIIMFLILYQEAIQKIPFFNEILFLLSLVLIFYILKQFYIENKKLKSGSRIKIKRQIDDLNIILSLLLGGLIIGFALIYSDNEMNLLEKVNYTILGLILITSGFINRKSLVLDKRNNSNIEVMESNIKIQSTDKDLTFSKFQIVLKKENDQIENLKELILNFKEAKQIANWLNCELNNSSLNYYWQIDDKIEKIKTDTNNAYNGK